MSFTRNDEEALYEICRGPNHGIGQVVVVHQVVTWSIHTRRVN